MAPVGAPLSKNSQMQGAGPQAALVAGKGRQRRRWLVLPEIPGKAFLWAHRSRGGGPFPWAFEAGPLPRAGGYAIMWVKADGKRHRLEEVSP